jgi:hypothetical protein
MAVYTSLFETLSDMSAAEVIDVLCHEFSAGRSTITFHNTGNRAEIRSFISAIYLTSVKASDVGPIEFWGGPPKKRDYYTGSLLTYLCDFILNRWKTNNEYADLITGYNYASQLHIANYSL